MKPAKPFNLAGATTLIVVAATYLVASLISGHSAASHQPTDLTATEQALNPYQAAELLVEKNEQVVAIDTRSKSQYAAYHLPRSVNLPNATPNQVLKAAAGHNVALVIAKSDGAASELVATVLAADGSRQVHFLQGGAQAFYLTFELPVAAFTDQEAPFGYHESVAQVRRFLHEGTGEPKAVRNALETLASIEYSPSQLAGKKPKASAKKKKISGGCG